MERDNKDYRIEIVPRWVRKVNEYAQCPTCQGSGKKCPFTLMWDEDEERDRRCENCHGRGTILVGIPPPPGFDPAFMWHMAGAFHEFWARQPEIQAAYALKKAHEDSLNSADL